MRLAVAPRPFEHDPFLQVECSPVPFEPPEDLSDEEFAELCRQSPAVFAEWVLGVTNGDLQNDMQAFVSACDDWYMELPRGHTKTSQLAARYAFEIGNDPDIRIKCVSSSEDEAIKTSKYAKSLVESDEFAFVFPDVKVDRTGSSNERWTVLRSRRRRDPTFEGVSVFGRAGGRADILAFDDICDLRNSVLQPTTREQVKDFVKTLWLPTRDLSAKRPPRTWRVGTPYHQDDITADWRRVHGKRKTLFRRPVVDFRSPWPEVFTEQALRDLRDELGPVAFARAYELVAVATDQLVFPNEWMDRALFFGDVPKAVTLNGRRVAGVDMAFTDKTEVKDKPDYSVIVFGWLDINGFLWVDRLWRGRENFPNFLRILARECQAARVRLVVCEQQGTQKGLVQQVRDRLANLCPVTSIPRQTDKVYRATHAGQPFIEAGRFRMRGNALGGGVALDLEVLYNELVAFPAADHDDCVDAAMLLIESCAHAKGGHGADLPSVVRSPFPKLHRVIRPPAR